MAWSYRIAPDDAVAMILFEGEVDSDTVSTALAGLVAEEAFHPSFDVIWDCRQIKSLALTPEELSALVTLRASSIEGAQISIVRRELDEIVATLINKLLSDRGASTGIVRSLEEAVRKLDLAQIPAAFQ